MKLTTTLLLAALLLGCKEEKKPTQAEMPVPEQNAQNPDYPDALQKVFEAHGGLQAWKKQQALVYTIPKPGNPETHSIDLQRRRDLVASEAYTMGYDGEGVWLHDPEQDYEGDPIFYHNLMFYFYAMPFVLADDGIQYGETEPLAFEGVSYPGIAIGYDNGVGTSPEDEYYIHYHPETFQMAWLGYTVTYHSGEASDDVHWIRYPEWQEVSGLLLPAKLDWYTYEGREIKELRNSVSFEEVSLNTSPLADPLFVKPPDAQYVKRADQ